MDWGFQELEAQAIAVRSYVLADLGGYGGYADTCDLSCQTYRGTEYETPASIAAANDTAGQVMIMPSGQIATTEYSSSTGGYTSSANQESPFTAVPDDGDAVCVTSTDCLNPNHNWTTSVSDAAVQNAWPQIGTFEGLPAATSDPGHPYDFPYGRVDTITIQGTAQTITDPRDGVLRRPRPEFGSLHRELDQRWRAVHHGTGLGSRHRDGAVRRARLRHRCGQRRRQLDLPADRRPLLRSGSAGQPAGRSELGRRRERRGRRVLDQRRRRRCLQLRQRAVLREHRRHGPQPARGRHGLDPRRQRVLGGGAATGASSASATRRSTAAPAASA